MLVEIKKDPEYVWKEEKDARRGAPLLIPNMLKAFVCNICKFILAHFDHFVKGLCAKTCG